MQADRGCPLALPRVRFADSRPFATADERAEVLWLIRRLLAGCGDGAAAQPPGAVLLELLSGSRSGAKVFKVSPLPDASGGAAGRPLVVKVAPQALAARERENYDDLVRPYLPPARRPKLFGYANGLVRAALWLSFVRGAHGEIAETLTDRLQRGHTAELLLFCDQLLGMAGETWYGWRLIRTEQDLAARYLARHFGGIAVALADEASLRRCAGHYFDAAERNGSMLVGAIQFPSPCAILFSAGRSRPYHSCIVHGDLNSDNVLVGDELTMIDFQRTGRGHVYEDLVALEASVRINYPAHASFAEIFEVERLIALGLEPPRENPYARAIGAIRAAAFRHFERLEGKTAYRFGVAAVGLRLMRTLDLSHAARARITASILWATRALASEDPA